MYCVQCGEYIEEGNAFCTKCGARADAGGDAVARAVPVDAAQSVQPGMTMPASDFAGQPFEGGAGAPASAGFQGAQYGAAAQAGAAQAPAKGGLPKAAIIAIAAVAVLAVAGVAFALTHSGGGHDTGTSTYTIESSEPAESGSDETADATTSDDSTTSGSEPSTSSSAAPEPDPVAEQAQREDEARQAALDAGKEVFTGQVIVTTMAQRAHDRASDLHDFDNYDKPYVVLQMDSTIQVTANSGDGQGMRTGDCDSLALPLGQFDAYDGQTITIAAYPSDMWFYSDVTGVLAPIHVNTAELIAPLDGSAPAASASTGDAASNGDYVLADSNSRYYTRDELEAMDDLTLYHARNEIFARHGRQFKNPDLQEFFGSKPWYSGTVAPEDFDEQVLNEYEDANSKLMLAIEQERNSPYLS